MICPCKEFSYSVLQCIVWLSILLLRVTKSDTGSSELPRLILISMDGFRYNLLKDIPIEKIPNFRFYIENGVQASYVKNVFPSVTYPNHMTIATGLYPESHGVVENRFYDPFLEDTFDYTNFRQNFESKWFDNGGEPIWVTNFKDGNSRDSGVIAWPGGTAEIMSFMPRVVPALFWNNVSYAWNVRIDNMIDWFKNNKSNIRPINFGVLYFEEPDETEHTDGPESDAVKQKIVLLDKALDYLRLRLKQANLTEKVNIIITADHGQTNIEKNIRKNLDEYVNKTLYVARVGLDSIVSFIDPAEGVDTDRLYTELRKIPSDSIEVIKKGDERSVSLHFSRNRRISQFILAAKNNYLIRNTINKGGHGYDPAEVHDMYPVFIAYGPAFKSGYKAGSFNMVDIYPLMCHVLGIQPAPNNGTLDNVVNMLVNPPSSDKSFQFTGAAFLVVVVFVAFVGGVYSIAACRQGRIKHYTQTSKKIINYSQIGHNSLLNKDDEDDDEF